MKRKVIFDKPSTVNVEQLQIGAIFLVDDEPYMRIAEVKDKVYEIVNSVNLCNGELDYWENADSENFNIEYFPYYQNIKIVGD